ncbi:MAG: C40 family peptidase, partial [Leptolyngbya sp. RL_3_1]|nr:C40 family peptidase [Leptolyngbya sp. RL_3_1]
MVTLAELLGARADAKPVEYGAIANLNLYKSPACEGLVTQMAAGRQLRVTAIPPEAQPTAIQVCLCEDDYPGWLAVADLAQLTVATTPYRAQAVSAAEIQQRLPLVIAFAEAAMATPNEYLWGGTVAPNYDCSGLMQAAFGSVGIQLPRDSYQQEAFTQPVAMADLQLGDLLFFGTPEKTTHVALYLGEGRYLHSSGQDQGRNGIGIDSVWDLGDRVSDRYYRQWRRG